MRPHIGPARQAQHIGYRPAVDGLRGIAVLAVLGFHAFTEYVPGGFVGVDVFFVVSGYLITSIILGDLQRGAFSFARFYARRIRRLFPTLTLVLVASLGLGWLVLLPDEFTLLGKHTAAAALFVANVAFWRETGYFDVAAEFKPLLHLWSLGVEEQFYLLWPVLLVALWKRTSLLLVTLWGLVLVSLGLSASLASAAPDAGFYSPFSRFWELGFGCLLAVQKQTTPNASPTKPPQHLTWGDLIPAAGLIMIVTSMFAFDHSTPFPSWRALLPAVGTLLVLAAPEEAWFQRRVLGGPVLVYVGLISYALYLWHWPLLSFANILYAGLPPASVRWTVLLSSIALAALTYHLLEVPIRRRRQFRINAGLVAAAAVACLSGLAVYTTAGFPERFEVDLQALRHGPRIDALCRSQLGEDLRINYCRTTHARPPDILVLGDSKAQAIYEAIAPLFASEHAVMLLGRGGCPPLLNVGMRGFDPNEQECPETWRALVNYVQRARPEVIVLVGSGSFLMTRPEIELRSTSSHSQQNKKETFKHGLRELMTELTQASRVIHVTETPIFPSSPSCMLRPVRLPSTNCELDLDRSLVESDMSDYNEALAELQRTLPAVLFVNAVDILCTTSECSQWPAGSPLLYSDHIHLSITGARLLIDKAGLHNAIATGLIDPLRR